MDTDNPVVKLCAEGMAVEGDPPAARALFEKAWAIHRDDYEASIAAHYFARHQSTPEDTLHWNALAAQHAERVGDDRVNVFLASLYLNLGESHRVVGNRDDAAAACVRARAALIHLPAGGYTDLVARAIENLESRLAMPPTPISGPVA